MPHPDISRVPNKILPSKSAVSIYRFPGGGGLLNAVATSPDKSLDLPGQAAATLAVLDAHLATAGIDRTRILRADVVVTDHDQKPAFDRVWASWMPDGEGPVRSFVQSVMPEGDLVEILITAALPA
ncbi:MAG: Rid family hydrolase [Reyranella sp.]|nr:Rid family hydrolase [Reyranella sp.]